MKFKTHNAIVRLNLDGTCLQGEITISYARLCKLFGQPLPGDGDKTNAEWELEFEDGTVASIYNWKNGKTYDCENGIDTEKIRKWNIGGHSKMAVDKVIEVTKSKYFRYF